jgi:cytoskeletal protein CcmA (bactofilin family)
MGVDSGGNAVFAGQLNAATGSFAGSINVANNFIVDGSGNVTLNGNITWGTGASPT